MSDIVPPWLLGEHLTAVRIQGCTRATGGSLTALAVSGTSDFAMVAAIDQIRLLTATEHDDVRAVNNRKINKVITGDGAGLTLVEILKNDQTVLANVLPLVTYNFDYLKVTFTRGPNSWTGFYTRGPLRDGVDSHGKNTAELDLLPCDTGAANPVYSTP